MSKWTQGVGSEEEEWNDPRFQQLGDAPVIHKLEVKKGGSRFGKRVRASNLRPHGSR